MDNEFVSETISHITQSPSLDLSDERKPALLCHSCNQLDFWKPFNTTMKVSALKESSIRCDLCDLFWDVCQQGNGTNLSTVKFDRLGSILTMNGSGPPVLSIIRSPALKARASDMIPIGLPSLPKVGSKTHFEIIKHWIQDCDDNHEKCYANSSIHGSRGSRTVRLPTRIIDVGCEGSLTVRLIESNKTHSGEYIALSHPWGADSKLHFSTLRSNIQQYLLGINLADLPATFRDAVHTTRALGLPYLWIDSLCIIQGEDGDFNSEAEFMESVFSNAYCVIAASRSSHHFDGFLKDRPKRKYVTMHRENDPEPFFICENIDDFSHDVLEGALNKRGWVLQEHALARRTIFFTEKQTYWECGEGVRCETMTKMSNGLAAFMGDPNFPQIIMSATKGERIVRYQDLYKRYSGLDFTKQSDRAIAIDGLQNRLLKAFGTEGGFGIFDEGSEKGYLCRSLMWHRKQQAGSQLTRINFAPVQKVAIPSWSWMAYTGEIDYFQLLSDRVDWAKDIKTPWTGPTMQFSNSLRLGQNPCLITEVREFHAASLTKDDDHRFFFDVPNGSEKLNLKCAVLGIEWREELSREDKKHYLLMVTPTKTHNRNYKSYKRVGVGHCLGKWVAAEGSKGAIY